MKKTNDKNETNEYLGITNRAHEKKLFRLDEMNPVLSGVNEFTSKMVELRSAGNDKLLAMYLALLVKSEYFYDNKLGVNDKFGMNIDKSGVTAETLITNGGSLNDLEGFIEQALKFAVKVDHRSEAIEKLDYCGKKRKMTEDNPIKVKISKIDKVEIVKKAEINDPSGLELTFKQNFLGRADIHISKLVVSSQVSIPLSPVKVSGLATGMLQRFDPTQMCVMATPAQGKAFDYHNLAANTLEVFHGRHRLAALQQLEKKVLLGKLLGMERGMITVHIVNVTTATQLNYGAIRGNEIQADWVRKPHLHELIYILEGIREHSSQEKCQETITRYAKLLSFGAEEITALRKFGTWGADSLAELSRCLKLFENLKTLDGMAKEFVQRRQGQLKKKDSIAFPNTWFRKLAKVDETYFVLMAPKVVSKELSLKTLIGDFMKKIDRAHTLALVQKELGFRTIHELSITYPDKFGDEKLETFSGALIGKNSSNSKGEELRKYCQSVALDVEDNQVKYNCVDVKKLSLGQLGKFDLVVFNIEKTDQHLIRRVEELKAANSHTPIILLFAEPEDHLIACAFLKKSADQSLLYPKSICFVREASIVRGEYLENMIHGLVLAYGVYQGQLKDFNGPLCNIDEVVNQLTPPESILAFVNEGDLTITSIHSLSACEYFGGKSSIVKFSKSLGESIGQGVINEDVIGSNMVLGLGDIDKVDMNSNTVNGGFNEAEINSDFVSDPIGEVEDITVFEPKACSSFLGAPGSNKSHAATDKSIYCYCVS